jgi:protein involved in sex pheromone biosynthesis
MKSTAKNALLLPILALGLGLAACQSKQEEAADKTADAVAASSDAVADSIDRKLPMPPALRPTR